MDVVFSVIVFIFAFIGVVSTGIRLWDFLDNWADYKRWKERNK